jgi:hypothetical protein
MELKELLFYTLLIFFKGNRDFFTLINDFHDKMPPGWARFQPTASFVSVDRYEDPTHLFFSVNSWLLD